MDQRDQTKVVLQFTKRLLKAEWLEAISEQNKNVRTFIQLYIIIGYGIHSLHRCIML